MVGDVWARLLSLFACVLASVPAQDEGKREAPVAPAPTAAELARAKAVLDGLVEAHREHAYLRAEFVQRRHSKLLPRPLVSAGELLFRRDPGCVLFRIHEPRATVVRLQATTYEVFRPEHKRLERFVLPDPDMPRLLFSSLSPTAGAIGRDFDVLSCRAVDEHDDRQRLTLRPVTKGNEQGPVESVWIEVDTSKHRIVGFGYRDLRGDAVDVELRNVELPDELADERFATGAGADTEVVTSRVPARERKTVSPPARSDG